MNNPSPIKKISVIIPCFNEEKYIAALIENLLEQDYPKEYTEIIFADGLSTDKTKEIIRSYQDSPLLWRGVGGEARFL